MNVRTLSPAEFRKTFGEAKRIKGHHSMTKRVLHWPYCANCGLMALKNAETKKALKSPCVYEE